MHMSIIHRPIVSVGFFTKNHKSPISKDSREIMDGISKSANSGY